MEFQNYHNNFMTSFGSFIFFNMYSNPESYGHVLASKGESGS